MEHRIRTFSIGASAAHPSTGSRPHAADRAARLDPLAALRHE